ncbi:hypothetical protein KMZ30_07215 [Phycicoccus sp. KQZ13P-1]|uniref:hypothetical protein n=1 Tax=Phycicoccus mangrovi TaxID=2840470 RepID=UPI001C00351F|nr:hypothetical protein [Phycicoccus mangrovi]MBT9255360.1 hypothetical protein [Phycicoccus mangrovi]
MGANPWCYLDAPDLDRLDMASILVREAVGQPYLVGSVLTTPDHRDVDIRVILDDKRYRRLFEKAGRDALRHLVQVAITEHYVKATGLRIDFQIQSMSAANDTLADGSPRHPGPRHPLGMYLGGAR